MSAIKFTDILAAVSAEFAMPVSTILGPSRTQKVCVVRNVVCYLAREMTRLSFPQIGSRLSRDHTSIIHAVERAKEALELNDDLSERVGRIRETLRPEPRVNTVVIVNGRPRAGKDTFIDAAMGALKDQMIPSQHVSSIDIVRRMLAVADVDVSAKTNADRHLMSAIGQLIEQHSEAKTRAVVNEARAYAFQCRPKSSVMFTQIRETPQIARAKDYLIHAGFKVVTVLITSNRSLGDVGNESDDGLMFDYEYDQRLTNNMTLAEWYMVGGDFSRALIRKYKAVS